MAGKREQKDRKKRLPGFLALLGVLAVLLSPAGPSGVAADSPLEHPPAAAEQPAEMPQAVLPPIPVAEAWTPMPVAAAEPEKEAPEAAWSPVPESAAVEDTYFSDVAFLGDSRTEGFYLYSGLKEGRFFYGVGATVASVFTQNSWKTGSGKKIPLLDALADAECRKVYVMLGVNELGWNKVEMFSDQYGKVIDRIRADHPDVRVVLQSILPVSAEQEAKKTYVNNARILTYNETIKALAQEKACDYVDVASAVIGEDGCLRPELTGDGVHLNKKGCGIWLEYLRTHSV